MPFITNSKIAKKYKVAMPTVTRWIHQASLGNNNLQLEKSNGKLRVLDNENNIAELDRLATRGRAYKPQAGLKEHTVDSYFYDVFTISEQLELFTDLKNKKQINLKYYYKNGGAELWNKDYFNNFGKIKDKNQHLLENSFESIKYLIPGKKINIIDIGTGNGYPVKELIEAISPQTYIGLDISPEMLDLARGNINKWYPDLNLKTIVTDFERTQPQQLLLSAKNNNSTNLILLLGHTICNLSTPISSLLNIRSGMLEDDLLVFTASLDTIANRSNLDYVKGNDVNDEYAWIPRLLGIDVEDCKLKLVYDGNNKRKVKSLILDKDYKINFNIDGINYSVLLERESELIRWQHYLFDIQELIELVKTSGFEVKQLSADQKGENVLVICRAKY